MAVSVPLRIPDDTDIPYSMNTSTPFAYYITHPPNYAPIHRSILLLY